jgi:microcystin degradation protein MlrC
MPGSAPRVGVVAFLHESNTFLEQPTTLTHFRQDLLVAGPAVRDRLAPAHHEVGGFFAGLAAAAIEAVPLVATRALPGGTIDRASYAALMQMVDDAVTAAGPLDGILAAAHGATVSEEVPDADGYFLQLLRERVGSRPLIATIDPHANLSPAMIAAADAITAYRTNPHLDQRDRGLEAARLMALTLAGRIRPTQAAAFPPLAIGIDCQDPAAFPCRPHYDRAAAVRGAFEGLDEDSPIPRGIAVSSSIVLGFPYADVAEMGSAAIVVTNDDAAAARRHRARTWPSAAGRGRQLRLRAGCRSGGSRPCDGARRPAPDRGRRPRPVVAGSRGCRAARGLVDGHPSLRRPVPGDEAAAWRSLRV